MANYKVSDKYILFLILLPKLSALNKVGALLELRLVSIGGVFHQVDLFTIGVDSIRIYILRYYSIYLQIKNTFKKFQNIAVS